VFSVWYLVSGAQQEIAKHKKLNTKPYQAVALAAIIESIA
jgi:hypothetical protein